MRAIRSLHDIQMQTVNLSATIALRKSKPIQGGISGRRPDEGGTTVTSGFHLALAAAERSPEIPESGDVYGWLIGSWELEVVHYRVDVSARGLRAEAHFGWVLEGRAVQDVWIMPPRPPGD